MINTFRIMVGTWKPTPWVVQKQTLFNGFFESYLCQTEMDPHFGYTTTFTEKHHSQ